MKKGNRSKEMNNEYCPECCLLVPAGKRDTIMMIRSDRIKICQGHPEHYHGEHFDSFLKAINLNHKIVEYLSTNVFGRLVTINEVINYGFTLQLLMQSNARNGSAKQIEGMLLKISDLANCLGTPIDVGKTKEWANYLSSPNQTSEEDKKHIWVPELVCHPVKARKIFGR